MGIEDFLIVRGRLFILFFVTAGFAFLGCSKGVSDRFSPEKTPSKLFPDNVLPCTDEQWKITGGSFVLIRNIEYSDGLVGDLYLPSDLWDFPVAIHVHGGGWAAGSRRLPMARYWGELLACNGVAVFDIEYTLIPKADIYKQVKEIKCAILWVKTQGKEKYGFGDKVFIFGGSAGGHLTALASFSGEEIFPSESECKHVKKVSSPDVNAVIPFYGVYDFTLGYTKFLKRLLHLNTLPESEIERILREISPINYTQKVTFPVLLIHGSADFVPLAQSYLLYDNLKSKGKEAEILVIENGVHAFDVFPDTEFTQKAKVKIMEFLKKHNFISVEGKKEVSPLNYQEHIKRGYKFLENGNFKQAFAEFSSAGKKDCETEYGKLLALSYDALNDTLSSYQSGLLSYGILNESVNLNMPSFSSSRIGLKADQIKGKTDLNFYYENYILPLKNKFDTIGELSQFVIQNSCTFYISSGIPIYDNNFTAEIRIGKRFGREFPLLAVAISQAFKFVFNLVFSHDLYFDVGAEKTLNYLIPYAFEAEQKDFPGLLRLAGILIEENGKFLKFYESRADLFGEAKKNLSNSLDYFAKFIEESFLVEDDCDVLCWRDGNFFGVIKVVGESKMIQNMRLTEGLISFIYNKDYIKIVAGTLRQIKLSLDNDTPINFGLLNNLVPDVAKGIFGNIFPDFVSMNIGRFFGSRRPLRDFIPEVVYTDILPKKVKKLGAGNISVLPLFLIEYELGKSAQSENFEPEISRCFVCPPGKRFLNYVGSISIDGKIISELEDDEIALQGVYVFSNFGIPYIYYKDPSFDGNLYISSGGEFRLADQFLINFAVARFLVNLEKVLSILRR